MIKKEFGTDLRRLRLDHRFTQEALADHANIAVRFLKDLEAGKKQPSITTLFKLSLALKVNPDQLIQSTFEKWRSQQLP